MEQQNLMKTDSKLTPNQIFRGYIETLNSMELKDKDLYTQYAMMKNAYKILADRIDELSEIIVEEMKREGSIKKEFDYGKFSLTKRAKWTYSEEVEKLNTSLKETKKKEEDEGIAVKEETEYLNFR